MWITFSICGKERLFVDKKQLFLWFSFLKVSFFFIKTEKQKSYPPKIQKREGNKNAKVDKLSTENRGFLRQKPRKAVKIEKEQSCFCKSYPQSSKNNGGQPIFIHNSVDKRLKKYTFSMYKRFFST